MAKSISFNRASSQYLQNPSPGSLTLSGTWTIAMWIKYGGATTKNYLLNLQTNSGGWLHYLTIDDASGTQTLKVDGLEFTGFSQVHLTGPAIAAGTWYFVVLRLNATSKTTYLNVNTVSYGNGSMSNVYGGAFSYDEVGGRDGATTECFDGLIYLPSFWSRDLSGGEESSLYNAGNAKLFTDYSGLGLTTGLVAAYDAEDGTDLGLDASGNAVNLTNLNGVTQSSTTPYVAASFKTWFARSSSPVGTGAY